MENLQEKIEDKVIDCINAGAGGRLIIFKPENTKNDLIVEKRGDYKKKTITLNIYEKEKIGEFKNLNLPENSYLVFVDFDIVKQDIENDILIAPAGNLEKKFSMDKKDLALFLLEKIEDTKKP